MGELIDILFLAKDQGYKQFSPIQKKGIIIHTARCTELYKT